MSQADDAKAREIARRYFENRRVDDADQTIDDLLETIGPVENRDATRTLAARLISRASRADSPEQARETLAEDADFDEFEDFPELEGYDVIDIIGRGGMGIVYEAYQRSTGRCVALKFMLDAATNTESGRRRFEREVELIARLQHPNVVSVIDSGVLRGRHYYIMDYVEGRCLDEAYIPGECEINAALRIIAGIARAIDFAHQHGVLHRDLKPGNVLIDEFGEPQLLDFGLAKAIEGDGDVDMTLSQPGQLLGTLGYMPPEQARGDMPKISIRSDVYSVGAIAYELITGRLPCEVDGSLGEILRRIELQPPSRPSTIRRKVGPDIDAMLLKALEKEPTARYPTAAAFADDIERFLRGEPILARPVGPLVRGARWVRRNRTISTVAAAALALIVLVTSIAFVKITGERDKTQAVLLDNIERLEEIPVDGSKEEIIAAFLDPTAANIAFFDKQPRYQAQLRSAMGLAYRRVSDYRKAELQFRQALESNRKLYKPGDPRLAETHHLLASSLYWLGDYARAEAQYREALEVWRRADLSDAPDLRLKRARSLAHLASTLAKQEKYDEAQRISREALHLREQLVGKDHIDIAESLNNLATILNSAGNHQEVPALCRRGINIIEANVGRRHRGVAALLHNLGLGHLGLGNFEKASEALEETLRLQRSMLVDDHASIGATLHSLAELRLAMGDLEEAERLCRESLRIRRERLAAPHATLADSLMLLGTICLDLARPEEAREALLECREMRTRLAGGSADHAVAEVDAALARCAALQDRSDEAPVGS